MSELVMLLQVFLLHLANGTPVLRGGAIALAKREPTLLRKSFLEKSFMGTTAALVQRELVLTAHGVCAEEEHKAEACRTVWERRP